MSRIASCMLARRDDHVTVILAGDWRLARGGPDAAVVLGHLRGCGAHSAGFDCSGLGEWDSLLVTLLFHLATGCEEAGIDVAYAGLPDAAVSLLELSRTVAARTDPPPQRPAWWLRLLQGEAFIAGADEVRAAFAFVGDVIIALVRAASGQGNMRSRDFFWFLQQTGPAAIGIVTLISVLVGMILAYLGSVQLRQFGAQIYIADLVGIGMMREMGALMTGVIMAGRTGAAFAAQIGTMQTREEIDAVRTLGIDPVGFLVLPRLLALVTVMPLLTLYSGILGMCGGGLVALGMDVSWAQYLNESRSAVTLTHVMTGELKSVAFGLVIAIAGCHAGMACGRSSEAVGRATTRAVVSAIVWLIVTDAAFNILYQRLGI